MFYIGSIIKCGLIGGGISAVIPAFLHLKSFNDFYEIVDAYKISETEPILDCEQYGLHYRVYLTAKEEGKWDINDANDSITFSVVNVKDSNLSWGGTRESKYGKWNNWKLRVNKDEIHLQIPDTSKSTTFEDQHYRTLACKNSKIVSKFVEDGREITVVANSFGAITGQNVAISFKLQENSSCKKSEKRTECEILFNENNNLNWVSDFKPKAYFYL